ncbi:DegT/DnrJ/EryC1/StrS family aminotransferase [Streptomyces sp. DK15]|uniref:DegT/DnrJ/EryC1/StrS family aminotransferase n=1 Tax=Streptomyces sp. DK15 TaxID=2957499 RepID=UPI0029A71640|nr:DegT/DnrJ/EryC1/StrS family aminotransferase [Streptomyces sp. DK15]MDX2393592.1 DegT/DnrJ/EryC1/StrS family aminotransferase [Streptomyces sp. DK15]
MRVSTTLPDRTVVVTVPAEGHGRRVAALRETIHQITDAVIDSGKFHYGPQTERLEDTLSHVWGGYAVATTSCTQALVLALEAAGVRPRDEVIVPAATFAATAFAVAGLGAVPVIVDVTESTLTLCPKAMEAAVTDRTRAVIPVHLHGHMADMPAINQVAARHGLAVIEDCAQAPGASLQGRAAGTWGDYGCFSFWVGKNIGGLDDAGAILTTTPERAGQLRRLTDMGRDHGDRHLHHVRGHRARLGEVNAGILTAQLGLLPSWIERRNIIARRYTAAFAELPLETPVIQDGHVHAFYKYALGCEDIATLTEHLANAGIEAERVYPYLLPDQPAFEEIAHRSHVTERSDAATRRLCLPAYPELTDPEVDHVIAAVTAFYTGS